MRRSITLKEPRVMIYKKLVLVSFFLLLIASKTFLFSNSETHKKTQCDFNNFKINSTCEMNIDLLKPTQAYLGYGVVKEKKKTILQKKKVSQKYLQSFLNKKIAPVVIGPNKNIYLINYHHFARALFELKFETLWVKIIEDLSTLDEKAFWNIMELNQWALLIDKNKKLITPSELPQTVFSMPDFLFRTVSYHVHKRGGYCSVKDSPYIEFIWAIYFSRKLPSLKELIVKRLKSKSAQDHNKSKEKHDLTYLSPLEELIELGFKLARDKTSEKMAGYSQSTLCPQDSRLFID